LEDWANPNVCLDQAFDGYMESDLFILDDRYPAIMSDV
jgi:hypothetical protein